MARLLARRAFPVGLLVASASGFAPRASRRVRINDAWRSAPAGWRALSSTRGGDPSVEAQHRKSCPVGALVDVVQKEDQRSGELTRGVVARHLTNKPFHPRGIKVLLAASVVGRVFDVVEAGPPPSPEALAELARTPNPQRGGGRRGGGRGRRRRGGGGGGEARKVASFTG